MKLSKATVAILKTFSQINPSVYLRQGSIINTKSLNNAIYAEAKIADTIDSDLALYDVAGFLNVLALFNDEVEITVEEGEIHATISDKKSTVKYSLVDPSVIVYPKKVADFPTADLVFSLKNEDFVQVKSAAATLGMPELCITSRNGKIVIDAVDRKNPAANSFSVEVADYDGGNEFNFYISVANLKMEKSDFTVRVSKLGAVQFEGVVSSHIIGLEKGSEFK